MESKSEEDETVIKEGRTMVAGKEEIIVVGKEVIPEAAVSIKSERQEEEEEEEEEYSN